MQRLRELLAHGGIATLAVVFALAFAASNLATAFGREGISVVVQHTGDEDGGQLTFTIADTRIYYGEALLYAITLAMIVLLLFASWRLTRRAARACQECPSYVPLQASVCRFCTAELPPDRADA